MRTIVTASFNDIEILQQKGFLCISTIGKVYGNYVGKEDIQRIIGLNIFRHYHHQKVKDYKSCYFLYQYDLERLGFRKIMDRIMNVADVNNSNKLALCGYGSGNDFCYRHILSLFLRENDIDVLDFKDVDYNLQKEYWTTDIYTERGHFDLEQGFVGQQLESCVWIAASTMPNNPHSYTLRKHLRDDKLYLGLVKHIRNFGKMVIFQGIAYKIFHFNNYKYWTMPCDYLDEDCNLINRAKL
jgi:hypothetical protein